MLNAIDEDCATRAAEIGVRYRADQIASELICIGYGFGDRHTDEPMADWLAQVGDRQLSIVNPGINSCPSRFGHLCRQVSFVPKGAAEYFLHLGGDAGSYTQRTMRSIRAEKRKRMMMELLA